MSIPSVAYPRPSIPLMTERAAPSPRPLPSLAGARVLIAEDNAVNKEVAAFHLEDLGCFSVTAENGAVALSLSKQQPFDFVLMDCQMPVMDGFEALAAIRAHELGLGLRPTTIIAVTAADDAESQAQCAAAGFDGFLAKPFSAEQLRSVLTDYRSSLARTGSQSDKHPPCAKGASRPNSTASAAIDSATFSAFLLNFGLDTAPSLLGSFVKLLRETKTRLTAAHAKQDTPMLQALAHKVAGASATVGAMTLAQAARTIDAACKSGKFKWTDEASSLGDALDTALYAFEPLLASGGLEHFVSTQMSI